MKRGECFFKEADIGFGRGTKQENEAECRYSFDAIHRELYLFRLWWTCFSPKGYEVHLIIRFARTVVLS